MAHTHPPNNKEATNNLAVRLRHLAFFKKYNKTETKLLREFENAMFDQQLLKEIALHQLIHSQELCEQLPHRLNLSTDESITNTQKALSFHTKWRTVAGLGGSSVFETGMTLHHIYGIPYFPASSIKGLVRSFLISEYFGNEENPNIPELEKTKPLVNAEYRAYQDLNFCYLFGAPKEAEKIKFDEHSRKPSLNNRKKRIKLSDSTALAKLFANANKKFESHIGNIVFFDAFPLSKKGQRYQKNPKIKLDIMNPHYPDYYKDNEGRTPPADWQSPVPIFFLNVEDTSFQFLFGLRK